MSLLVHELYNLNLALLIVFFNLPLIIISYFSVGKRLDDVTTYPLITEALVEKKYSKQDINKILGGNFLRVLKANEAN